MTPDVTHELSRSAESFCDAIRSVFVGTSHALRAVGEFFGQKAMIFEPRAEANDPELIDALDEEEL